MLEIGLIFNQYQDMQDSNETLFNLELVTNGLFSDQFKDISIEAYQTASVEDNQEMLVKIVLKTLEKTDPEKANIEHAAQIAEKMQQFAKEKLEELSKK